MKKIRNWVIGGLEHKIFSLVFVTIVLMVAAYTAVIIYQTKSIQENITKTAERQDASITEISGQTMDAVMQSTLSNTTQLHAYIVDQMFEDAGKAVLALAAQTKELYQNAQEYSYRTVNRPDPALEGSFSMQLIAETNVNLRDREIQAEVGLLGNLEDTMMALCSSGKVSSAFVATPSGLYIIMDDLPSSKFNSDGALKPFPVRQRPWYREAETKEGLFFSDLMYDAFTGNIELACFVPVYSDGKMIAVAGADLFLNILKQENENIAEEGSFEIAVNKDGRVILSPQTTGPFALQVTEVAKDLRESDDEELAAFVTDALQNTTDVRLVNVGNQEYYMAGVPLPAVGWSFIYIVDKALTDQQAVMMKTSMDTIREETLTELRTRINESRRVLAVLLVIIFFIGLGSALTVAKRIVKPLNTITKRIASISDTNLQFFMEDAYKTGDEIEVLATAFADISEKTVRYVHEIATVTAENQRVSTELDMAKSIQESQLPNIFPPYPDRPDFDIFASMTPAKEVGGDFYDFFLVDDDHLCMVIADVSGKGVPAALFMMISKILIKTRIQSGDTPGQALENVNRQLQEGGETDMFVTVWLCLLDIRTGRALISNAGHEHPAVHRKGGKYELVKYRHSPAIGMVEDITFGEHEFQMNPGDTLFVYTDGVPEATNAENELFGTERMLDALNKEPDANAQMILKNVRDSVDVFVKEAEQFDDLTMLCLEYKG